LGVKPFKIKYITMLYLNIAQTDATYHKESLRKISNNSKKIPRKNDGSV